MYEMQQEVAINRDWCLRSLISQAEGRQIDTGTDGYLIEQLNASHIGDTPEGNVTQCQIGGCAVCCLPENESGVLHLKASDSQAVCDQ